MMIVIAHARIQAARRAEFVAALPAFIKATRAEAGCLAYDFCESIDEPNHFATIERWTTRAASDAHMAAPHLQAFLGLAASCVSEAPSIEAAEVAGMERVL